MSNSPFAAPAAASGISWEDLNGSLLLIQPLSVEDSVQTTFGEKTAIRADISVLDGDQKGEEYKDTLVFPLVLQGQLRGRLGQKVLGRLGQGEAKAGQKPPWILTEATEDDIKVGTAHLSGQLSTPAAGGSAPPF